MLQALDFFCCCWVFCLVFLWVFLVFVFLCFVLCWFFFPMGNSLYSNPNKISGLRNFQVKETAFSHYILGDPVCWEVHAAAPFGQDMDLLLPKDPKQAQA